MNRETRKTQLDRQVDHLTGSLRDKGAVPGRDLWPEIEEAIGRTEQAALKSRKPARLTTWRIAALAASLALILGLGYIGTTGNKSLEAHRADTGQDLDLAYSGAVGDEDLSALQRLDRTLSGLNNALNQDPENRNLSRLVLLVHKSRANVLRQNTRELAR